MTEQTSHVDTWQAFSSRITFEDGLHASSVPVDLPLSGLREGAMRERNLNVLGTLAAFGERRNESADEDTPMALDLMRLDNKLNVLMGMLDQLLQRDLPLPPRQPVEFNAIGAVLPVVVWPRVQAAGLLRLHFDGCLALPLELPARLVQERDMDHVFVAFEFMDDVMGDALERLVFRHHRRKVAGRRLTSP
ncbi:PilZ domain-containing protein [Dyella solisilvae]|uniref:PilZ domain-containing protein n=1 Tax=Dyella solisilvae TaxID=1920168 RepID=A0A370K543_9GAMM|nr:PilZ domain-containing protein [Dyella solisilvae]RDI97728.1 PilZ domain-containing protein [Dyella solisilvae]